MNLHIFIGFSFSDKDRAYFLHNSLSNISQFQPYLAEIQLTYGINFIKRIQDEICNSHTAIFFLTSSSKNSQWVNQELGYSLGLKKREKHRNLPHIIPISESNVNLKGMIAKEFTDILFLDAYSEYEDVISHIHYSIRSTIRNGFNQGALNIIIECVNCQDEKNIPLVYQVPIPSQESINKAIELDANPSFETQCPQCQYVNKFDARTFFSVE